MNAKIEIAPDILEAIKKLTQEMMDARWNLNALNNCCSLFEKQIAQLQKEISCEHFMKRGDIGDLFWVCVECGQRRAVK